MASSAKNSRPEILQAKQIKRMAKSIFTERTEPLEFSKIHLKVEDSRPFKRANNRLEKTKLVTAALKNLGIFKDTTLYSTIGNSIIEVIVPTKAVYKVTAKIDKAAIEILKDFNPMNVPSYVKSEELSIRMKESAIKRIAYLYRKAGTKNMKNTVIAGLDDHTIDKVTSFYAQVEEEMNLNV
jgi:hypothetical protein